jgi:phosphate transport system permease protein
VNTRILKDTIARRVTFLLCLFVLSLIFFMFIGLYRKAAPLLQTVPFSELFFSADWRPAQGKFGMAGFVLGTLWVTTIAVVLAVPLSLLTAMFLAEYSSKRLRDIIKPVIDLLAGISPVVYGVWGMIALVPLVRDYLMPFLSEHFPFFLFQSENYTGFCALTAGIVLAIMIAPLIISIAQEVIKTVPFGVREASMAVGATKWQTTKAVVLRRAAPGIIAAIILGLSRAMGETMAVLMIAGCTLQGIPKSIFDPAYPLPALIANTYGEMMSIPLYEAAVLLAAFILLAITIFFNMLAWGMLIYIERREA